MERRDPSDFRPQPGAEIRDEGKNVEGIHHVPQAPCRKTRGYSRRQIWRRGACEIHEQPDVRGQEVRLPKTSSTARSIRFRQKTKQDPLNVFHEALRNVSPALEVRSRRVGGATYQVPVEVRTDRSRALAIRWIITAARNRNEPTMQGRLSGELMDAASNRGTRRQEARRHAQDG